MPKTTHFTPALFEFLDELARHNERPWFEANKARYVSDVRDPFLQFIADLAPRMKKVSAQLVVDPKPVGGSMFRIHRDTRFSKDKSPYKTHVAAHFPHARCEGSAPGFYLRLDPESVLIGGGVWHPEAPELKRIRDAIAGKPADWKKAIAGRELDGEKLARPPKGYDADHPLVEDLKRKDFITGAELEPRDACAAGFLDRFVGEVERAAPLVRFLTKALGLPF